MKKRGNYSSSSFDSRITMICALGCVLLPFTSQALILDWDVHSWSASAQPNPNLGPNSFDVDGDGINDIRITISGSTDNFIGSAPGTSTQINGGTGENALALAVDYNASADVIRVKIDFLNTAGVYDVNFKIFDIDKDTTTDSHYTDRITDIKGQFNTGPLVYPNLTGSVNNTVANNGTASGRIEGKTSTADNSSNANGTINFGGNIVNTVSFVYTNGAISPSPPATIQWVALHDINFKKVPEVGTSVVAALLCGGLIGLRPLLRRMKRL